MQRRERDLKNLKAGLAEVNEFYHASWQETQNLYFEVSRSRFQVRPGVRVAGVGGGQLFICIPFYDNV